MTEFEMRVVDKMAKYGGAFVRALAECFYHADTPNFVKLRLTFSNYWDEYENFKN